MLNAFRIVIAGTLLFGNAFITAPVHAGVLTRTLPRAEHSVKVDPCKATWPYIVRSCLA